MEQLQIASFRKMLFQSRNAEEALLVVLNACARVTDKVSKIEHPDPTAFGAWFKRIQGQRSGAESVLAADCLSFLNLSDGAVTTWPTSMVRTWGMPTYGVLLRSSLAL